MSNAVKLFEIRQHSNSNSNFVTSLIFFDYVTVTSFVTHRSYNFIVSKNKGDIVR